MRTNGARQPLVQVRRGDHAGDAGVERKLQDDAPDGRRRVLDGAHQPRRRSVQQNAEQQKREVQDVQVERVQRLAGRREVAHEIDAAESDDDPRQQRGMLEPLPGRERARHGGRRFVRSSSRVRREGRCRGLARSALCRRGGVASHMTSVTTTISTSDRAQALPEKDRVPEGDDAAGHHAAGRDDVADLRLQRAGRRHLQRRGSAEALRPDAAEAQEARGGERAIVHALDPSRHLAREHGGEDQAEAPVEPRAGEREERHECHRARGERGQPAMNANHAPHRPRRREHVAGDDHERHLQRERNQIPESAAPGVDGLPERGGCGREGGHEDDERGDQREDERVGNPALGPRGQLQREPRDETVGVGVG